MEMKEIEPVLEKIWDLHDKLSYAIHSISRSDYLNSLKKPDAKRKLYTNDVVSDDNNRANGFVFVKDFNNNNDSTFQEVKSLNAIRTALENLEDQLELFHTVQTQQWAERDAAIAQLEQSRIVLAMRLAEHQGQKYKFVEEAMALVEDVYDASHFVSPKNLYGSLETGEHLVRCEGKSSNVVSQFFISSLDFAKKSLKLDNVGGVLGNAALFAVSMIAILHLHQVAYRKHPYKQDCLISINRNMKRVHLEGSSSNGSLSHLDVMLAQG